MNTIIILLSFILTCITVIEGSTSKWVETNLPIGTYYSLSTSSSSGSNLTALATYEEGIYHILRSTDYGNTWAETSATSAYYCNICQSASGQYIYAGGDSVFVSSDWGYSWTSTLSLSMNSQSIASSSSGQYVAVVSFEIFFAISAHLLD